MIKFTDVSKSFNSGVSALSDVNLEIQRGSFVFLVGHSGAGKTTLMRLINREYLPTKGTVIVKDWDLTTLPTGKILNLRRAVGVVFQDLKILTDRTVSENVALPLQIGGIKTSSIKEKVGEVLSMVGLTERMNVFPLQLSGGEMQRAAIARALITDPEILLADEPTGNLDPATSWEIVNLLDKINKSGTTVIMATHNADIVNSLKKRVISLDGGRIIKDEEAAPYGTS